MPIYEKKMAAKHSMMFMAKLWRIQMSTHLLICKLEQRLFWIDEMYIFPIHEYWQC